MWFFTEEEKQLQQTLKDFSAAELAPYAETHDNNESFNLNAFKKMANLGVLGITAEEEFGGAGLGATAATIAMEEFGRHCASSALSYLAHSILCVNNISNNASKAQKEKYLPKLISGEHIGCMGMSEPEFGSDAVGLQTKAEKKSDHYLLNGTKMWITNAACADVAYVYTRTGKDKKNLTTFIVDKDCPGFSAGKPIHKMGMRASPTGELIFDNAKVPFENRVGDEGDAVYHMMKNLDIERITICGISLGLARGCLEECITYANQRKQFGKTIGHYQMIQKIIADMSAHVEMIKHYLYSACKAYDLGQQGPLMAAQLKLAIPRLVTQIGLDAIQLMGGYGYSREFPVERYARDAKLMEIGAGTNEVMVLIIAKRLLELGK